MAKLDLTFACWETDRTRPLIDGRVKPEGIALEIEVLRPGQIFQRMLGAREFQVSELSLASYTSLKGRGACPFVAIPVALSKIFRHSCIYVRTDAGIKTPRDLKGKRVGTSQYGATAIVFIKGMLQHEYGVLPSDIAWIVGGLDKPTERPLIPLDLPSTVKLDFLPEGETLQGLLEEGRLDALFSIDIPPMFLAGSPRIARLFRDYKSVEKDYYRRTGIFPIMHIVALREDVYRAHPWAAKSLYAAFRQARDLAIGELYDTDELRIALPWLISYIEETRDVFGADIWSYGLEPNRRTLAAIGQYVYEQALSPRPVLPEELFAPDVE